MFCSPQKLAVKKPKGRQQWREMILQKDIRGKRTMKKNTWGVLFCKAVRDHHVANWEVGEEREAGTPATAKRTHLLSPVTLNSEKRTTNEQLRGQC